MPVVAFACTAGSAEMDVYPVSFAADSSKQQERHYYLLSELQTLVKGLPR